MNANEKAEYRRATLRDYHQSGLTQKAFCRSRGVALSTLGYWLKQERESADSEQAFIKVPSPVETPPRDSRSIRVYINGSLTVEIDLPIEEDQLREILKAAAAV